MFERFTDAAREAVVHAQTLAQELQADEIGDEHLLLALLQDDDGPAGVILREAGADAVAYRALLAPDLLAADADADSDGAEALRALGIDLDAVRRRAEETFGPGALDEPATPRRSRFRRAAPGHLRFSAPAEKVLENSLRAALEPRDRSIGSEHVLLGILAESRSTAVEMLHRSGVELDRDALLRVLRDHRRRSA